MLCELSDFPAILKFSLAQRIKFASADNLFLWKVHIKDLNAL